MLFERKLIIHVLNLCEGLLEEYRNAPKIELYPQYKNKLFHHSHKKKKHKIIPLWMSLSLCARQDNK